MHLPTKGTLRKRSAKSLLDDDAICFCFSIIIAFVLGTLLNCIDKSIQFKCVPTIYAFKMVVI